MMKEYCVLFLIISAASCDLTTLKNLHTKASWSTQSTAAKAVVERLLGTKATFFDLQVNGNITENKKDKFHIFKDTNSSVVRVIGNSGVAACWGFYHYLKHYCHCHISWDGDQINLPYVLPSVNITISSQDMFRYYLNVVTTSYSFVWWKWEHWQREIDWMALNGINIALAFTGQEAIWQRVYHKLNLTQNEIDEHFCGPAFLSWCRMGNIRGWGGPLSQSWHNSTLNLQHRILNNMRDLGIIPVLPAFAGHVPKAFKRVFPEANMTRVGTWNRFLDRYCCPYLLEPTDPLFQRIGNMFLLHMIEEFGTNHIYSCDTFNEMSPRTGDETYLKNIGIAIFQTMTDVDPDAVWLKQGWVFAHDPVFWTVQRAEAFLTSVPKGRMLILDLQSELNPQYLRLQSYFGQPFVWCMLHNFGGTLGLYGAIENVNKGIFAARSMNGSTMVGIGLTPEGINQNYVMYDFVLDLMWRNQSVDLNNWISAYSKRRYGYYSSVVDNAWQLLKSGVYNFSGLRRVRGKYIMCRRPSLKLKPWYWYSTTDLQVAWDKFIEASSVLHSSSLFKHDLVDISRQALQVLADAYYSKLIRSFRKKNLVVMQKNAAKFTELMQNMDDLLATNKGFMLGPWLKDAKEAGTTLLEQRIYEFNARNQITLWGPLGEIRDYATKQWSGIFSAYYLPRWVLFFKYLNISLTEGLPFDNTAFNTDVFELVEEPFTKDTSYFPEIPKGDSIEIAKYVYKTWRYSKAWLEAQRYEEFIDTSLQVQVILF